jgi:chromosome segregation ATPase
MRDEIKSLQVVGPKEAAELKKLESDFARTNLEHNRHKDEINKFQAELARAEHSQTQSGSSNGKRAA